MQKSVDGFGQPTVILHEEEYLKLMDQGNDLPTIRQQTIQVNGRYRVQFEKAASANKVDGFKVEVNGDDMDIAFSEAKKLYDACLLYVEANRPALSSIASK